ncbi:NADP-dependent oxidoreductase domain-containing protein [Aspergillus karnatakaensis]|uniref:NADP-dependent oxidoreductase domain-containing protein n=1 Tax=Aspergillus karnatakaensis TaxID=1810916 RepID=UPI003CCE1683
MPTRALSRNSPSVSLIGLGLISISSIYGAPPSEEKYYALLNQAYKINTRFWDTANRARNPKKSENIFITTKFGIKFLKDSRQDLDSSPKYARAALERSLKQLRPSPLTRSREDKIRHIGLSKVSSDTVRRAHAVHPITTVQVEYSPYALDIKKPHIIILEIYRELGITIIAYSPVGRGLLARKHTAKLITKNPSLTYFRRFSKDDLAIIKRLYNTIHGVAVEKEVILTQVILAWLLARDPIVIPIPGTKIIKYLEENIESSRVKLTLEET